MKWIRYETGLCPRCGSKLTARIRTSTKGKSSFHFGSPIVYRKSYTHNMCCLDCGVEWSDNGYYTLVPMKEIIELNDEWVINKRIKQTIDEEKEKQVIQKLKGDLDGMKKKGLVRRFFDATVVNGLLMPVQAVKSLVGDVLHFSEKQYKSDPYDIDHFHKKDSI